MGGTITGGKLKPSYYSKKTKHKDDPNVRSPTLRLLKTFTFVYIYYLYFYSVDQHVHHLRKVI
jgi:hypothetical protein